jgi:hypothetical protein
MDARVKKAKIRPIYVEKLANGCVFRLNRTDFFSFFLRTPLVQSSHLMKSNFSRNIP